MRGKTEGSGGLGAPRHMPPELWSGILMIAINGILRKSKRIGANEQAEPRHSAKAPPICPVRAFPAPSGSEFPFAGR